MQPLLINKGAKKVIEILKTANSVQKRSDLIRKMGKTIAFVPTMGFLHKGHLSLMREGRRYDDLVVSIFVNPAQFGPNEDFESYPKNIEKDISLLEKEGVDAVFIPDAGEVYSDGFETFVSLDNLPNHLCGISRPEFFKGVATVVAKLFNIVKPHTAIFGHKDYQQLLVIKRMVQDMNFDIDIKGMPIVRDPDGLAVSSRNAYLSSKERVSACSLYKSLKKAKSLVENGAKDSLKVIEAATNIIDNNDKINIEYITICDPESLIQIKTIDYPALMAMAVKVGTTRLIDNIILTPH